MKYLLAAAAICFVVHQLGIGIGDYRARIEICADLFRAGEKTALARLGCNPDSPGWGQTLEFGGRGPWPGPTAPRL